MNKLNPFYREFKAFDPITRAESTIAWFYSGKRQPLINVETRYPVYADGEYDCTEKLQMAIDNGRSVYLPEGSFSIKDTVTISRGAQLAGTYDY